MHQVEIEWASDELFQLRIKDIKRRSWDAEPESVDLFWDRSKYLYFRLKYRGHETQYLYVAGIARGTVLPQMKTAIENFARAKYGLRN